MFLILQFSFCNTHPSHFILRLCHRSTPVPTVPPAVVVVQRTTVGWTDWTVCPTEMLCAVIVLSHNTHMSVCVSLCVVQSFKTRVTYWATWRSSWALYCSSQQMSREALTLPASSKFLITSSPCAAMLSWNGKHVSKMTYKPCKLGQTGLVFGLWSVFIDRSVHAGLRVSTCSGYDLCYAG